MHCMYYSGYMRMGLRISIFLVLLCVLSCCTGHRINHYLRSLDMDIGDSVVVDISTIIKEPFDCYYYSGGIAYRSEISELIGVKYRGRSISDDSIALLFIRNNQLIYEERFNNRVLDGIMNIKWGEAVASPYVMFIRRQKSSFWWYNADGPRPMMHIVSSER